MGRALARAKVNLFLHVGPVDVDGYHPIASLAAFADTGDVIEARPAEAFSLKVTGQFSGALGSGANLVETALDALGRHMGLEGPPPLALTLEKHLPVAAGLGGGSSDAGGALKLARDMLGLSLDDAALAALAAPLGADMAMCLNARAAVATGRGEVLSPAPRLPAVHAVLANPGVPSATGAVYRAYDAGEVRDADRPDMPAAFDTVEALAAWLADQRNDLQAPAIRLAPAIGDALGAVAATGPLLARVTGSGATVFGLYPDAGAAADAADRLAHSHPDWWVRTCRLE